MNGTTGKDFFVGSSVTDVMRGGDRADAFRGGGGSDVFFGEHGDDTFIHDSVSDSDSVNSDTIVGFKHHRDVIDVRGVDAIDGGDKDAFTFIGQEEFSNTAGELRYRFVGDATWIEGDTNGDGVADFIVKMNNALVPVDLEDLIL